MTFCVITYLNKVYYKGIRTDYILSLVKFNFVYNLDVYLN